MELTYENIYYPEPESLRGWRYLIEMDDVRKIAGMDPIKLDRIRQKQEFLFGGDSWSVVVIRHGYLVREFHTFNVLPQTRFDIWSGTKSFTGTVWGILLDMSKNKKNPGYKSVELDSKAYDYIPEGIPLTDPRKEKITMRHLLTMTSGIPGEKADVIGIPTPTNGGAFEHALGKSANRFGRWADELTSDPGTVWDYSDCAIAHLALAFSNITGMEISEFLKKHVFDVIGIENLSWDVQGGGGFIGPHTNAHTGIHISARELARFGYLMLMNGMWKGQEIIPKWWIELAAISSQELNPNYGFTWWVNSKGTMWPNLPRDAYALMGYRTNKCYIIPSLDLVVARIGSGPVNWEEQDFITSIVDSIIDR